jgi:hypothetical protein
VKSKENVDESNNHKKNFDKFKKGKQNSTRRTNLKDKVGRKTNNFIKAIKWYKYGGSNHIVKK